MKDVFLGKVLPATSKEEAALAASRFSNARDRRVYDASARVHCTLLAAHPGLLATVWVQEELRAARLCTLQQEHIIVAAGEGAEGAADAATQIKSKNRDRKKA
jgi:hypothetical protein